MITLAPPVLLLLLMVPDVAPNPSWDPFRLRMAERHIDELERERLALEKRLAALEATQSVHEKLLWGAGAAGVLGAGGGAVALKRRKS